MLRRKLRPNENAPPPFSALWLWQPLWERRQPVQAALIQTKPTLNLTSGGTELLSRAIGEQRRIKPVGQHSGVLGGLQV